MGPPQRIRYNAKARQSSAGGSSHQPLKKKRKLDGDLLATTELEPGTDTNMEMLIPTKAKEKEKSRKDVLLDEMRTGGMNSKKKKRLEKYIDKKLKQEERQHLLYKLAETQSTTTPLTLQSSAMLGTGNTESHLKLRGREEDKEVRNLMTKGAKRGRGIDPSLDEDSSEDDESLMDEEMPGRSETTSKSFQVPLNGVTKTFPAVVEHGSGTGLHVAAPSLGSALALDTDGNPIQPMIVKKRRKKRRGKKGWNLPVKEDNDVSGDSDLNSSFSDLDGDTDQPDELDGEDEEPWGGINDSPSRSGSPLPHNGDEGEDYGGNEDDEDEEEAEEEEEEEEDRPPPRKSGFKEWAKQQVDISKGYVTATTANGPEAQSSHLDGLDTESPNLPTEPILTAPETAVSLPPSSNTLPGNLKGPLGSLLPSTSNSPFARRVLSAITHPRPSLPPVVRSPDIEASRLALPILGEEQHITETILLNPTVVLQGETGSGKTSQVVQFLWEAGFGRVELKDDGQGETIGVGYGGMIGITQPRRVAAMSMALRVGEELTAPSSSAFTSTPPSPVSYQIRYASSTSPNTRIKFMTEGILLRELSSDFLLRRYGVVILDEAHERSLGLDVLVGCLTRVVRLRMGMWEANDVVEGWKVQPLRLIIMSATLSLSSILNSDSLFPPSSGGAPPLITIPVRQHPLTIHFARRTVSDYVGEAVKKVLKIHRRLPLGGANGEEGGGGVLVFLTGQKEIEGVIKALQASGKRTKHDKAASHGRQKHENGSTQNYAVSARHAEIETEDIDLGAQQDLETDIDVNGGPSDLDAQAEDPLELYSDDEGLESEVDIKIRRGEDDESEAPMHIVPLYSLLPPEKQMEVFIPPPSGTRLVVVATNVAETSITIPGIRYVVDCGRAKERHYDAASGIQSFPVCWVSKASAQQRAGRAGRTGPGHVYRLYSSAVFENFFSPHTEPEILRMPIEGVVLTMKAMSIDAVANFPFPTAPDREKLRKAEQVLIRLGALEEDTSGRREAHITNLGQTMSLFPLSPRYSKMIVAGRQHGCLPYIVAIVSALSVGNPFIPEDTIFNKEGKAITEDSEPQDEDEGKRAIRKQYYKAMEAHASLGAHSSDMFKVLSVVGAFEFAGGGHKFCDEQFVRFKAMEEIHQLRRQIHDVVSSNFVDEQSGFNPRIQPPTEKQLKALRQLITSGFIDQIAARKDVVEKVPTGTKHANCRNIPYKALGISDDVYIHPNSIVFHQTPPDYVVFQDIIMSSKPYLSNITIINPAWLSVLGPSMCSFSKTKSSATVITSNPPITYAIPHFGPDGWELPPVRRES